MIAYEMMIKVKLMKIAQINCIKIFHKKYEMCIIMNNKNC